MFDYTKEVDEMVSEKTLLDFHLAHMTNPNFIFEPKDSTSKIIWKYLSSSNLLTSFNEVDIKDLEKIASIEKAVQAKIQKDKKYIC